MARECLDIVDQLVSEQRPPTDGEYKRLVDQFKSHYEREQLNGSVQNNGIVGPQSISDDSQIDQRRTDYQGFLREILQSYDERIDLLYSRMPELEQLAREYERQREEISAENERRRRNNEERRLQRRAERARQKTEREAQREEARRTWAGRKRKREPEVRP